MERTRGHPQSRPCGGDTPATLERDRQAPRAIAGQDQRAVIQQEYAGPCTASGMKARRAETDGGFPQASTSGSVHDSPTPAVIAVSRHHAAGGRPVKLDPTPRQHTAVIALQRSGVRSSSAPPNATQETELPKLLVNQILRIALWYTRVVHTRHGKGGRITSSRLP